VLQHTAARSRADVGLTEVNANAILENPREMSSTISRATIYPWKRAIGDNSERLSESPHQTGECPLDALFNAADAALRTLFVTPRAKLPCPASPTPSQDLSGPEKQLSGALMRVNHVGEVCAQALYTAQALATSNGQLRIQFERASAEETDHLAWTRQRLEALEARPSLLNPLWYAGAFGLGLIAGRLGDRLSLGFVAETERQVEAHLARHLTLLPESDQASRAIVAQMKEDEARHAQEACEAGALPLPAPIQGLMRLAAKVMTTVAHRI
jgi:ubiquinone biosynthesis monooxygenase Coq7